MTRRSAAATTGFNKEMKETNLNSESEKQTCEDDEQQLDSVVKKDKTVLSVSENLSVKNCEVLKSQATPAYDHLQSAQLMSTSGMKGAATTNTGKDCYNQKNGDFEHGNGINSYILTTTEMQTNQSNGMHGGTSHNNVTAQQNREEEESQVNLLERSNTKGSCTNADQKKDSMNL